MNGMTQARMEALRNAWEAFSSLPLVVRALMFAALAGGIVWLIWWNVAQDHKPGPPRDHA
jgi:hypothetical protein